MYIHGYSFIYLTNSHFYLDLDSLGIIKTDDDMVTRDQGYKYHGFNALVSLRLGNYRDSLPDTRHKL